MPSIAYKARIIAIWNVQDSAIPFLDMRPSLCAIMPRKRRPKNADRQRLYTKNLKSGSETAPELYGGTYMLLTLTRILEVPL